MEILAEGPARKILLLHHRLDQAETLSALEPFAQENPFISIKPGHEKVDKKFEYKNFFSQGTRESVSSTIEALSIDKKSLFQVLCEQVNPPLFPTEKSQNIAYEIIENINSEGYFDPSCVEEIINKLGTYNDEIEKIVRIDAFSGYY